MTGSLTLHYNKVLFLLEPTDVARGLARKRVTVHEFPDGRLAIRHRGVDLPFRAFDKLRRVDQAAVVENKRLGAVLARSATGRPRPRASGTGPPRAAPPAEPHVPRLSAGARRCATRGLRAARPPAAGDNSTLRAGYISIWL